MDSFDEFNPEQTIKIPEQEKMIEPIMDDEDRPRNNSLPKGDSVVAILKAILLD